MNRTLKIPKGATEAEREVAVELWLIDEEIEQVQRKWAGAFPSSQPSPHGVGSLILDDARKYVVRAQHAGIDKIRRRLEAEGHGGDASE